MQNSDAPLPEVEKVSRLIDAIREYALRDARESCNGHGAGIYHAPCLASWDAFAWFELVKDWEIVDYLLSGSDRSKRLLRSLQACVQWYGQGVVHDLNRRMGMIN